MYSSFTSETRSRCIRLASLEASRELEFISLSQVQISLLDFGKATSMETRCLFSSTFSCFISLYCSFSILYSAFLKIGKPTEIVKDGFRVDVSHFFYFISLTRKELLTSERPLPAVSLRFTNLLPNSFTPRLRSRLLSSLFP
jgi:hypothetical protein